MRNIVIFLGFILFFLYSGRTYCQSDKYDNKLTVISDVTTDQQEKFNDLLLKKSIVDRVQKAPRFVAYRAFRQNDTSLCLASSDPTLCAANLKVLKMLKRMASGTCDDILVSPLDTELCRAVVQNNCTNLNGYKKMICVAMLTDDKKLMLKAVQDQDFPDVVLAPAENVEYFFNLYRGFKQRSAAACYKFNSRNLLNRASCNMLWGDASVASRVNEIIQDIFYAAKSKIKKDKGLCQQVKDPIIRNVCNDDAVRNLDDIIHTVWP